mgnify:CR=1 FL=1
MTTIHKKLMSEYEATTLGLQRQIVSLQQMIHGSDEMWSQYHLGVWTQGEAARQVAEIASSLSRQQALQEAIRLLNETQE